MPDDDMDNEEGPAPTTTAISYHDRVVQSIQLQATERGILPEEFGSVKVGLETMHEKKLIAMNDRELRRVQQRLDEFFREYLDGQKRRGESTEERKEWTP